jgi:hypothetical protein
MGIQSGWYDAERTIQLWQIDGTWMWDEFNRHMLGSYRDAQAVSHRYDAITDLSRCHLLPPETVARAHLAMKYAPANLGVMVVVGLRPIFEASLRAIRRVHPRLAGDLYLAATLEEALHIVEQQRGLPTRSGALAAVAPAQRIKTITGLLKAVS